MRVCNNGCCIVAVLFPDPIPVSPCGTSVGTADIEEFVPEGDVDSFLEETEEGEEEEDLGRSEEERWGCVSVCKLYVCAPTMYMYIYIYIHV